jgi:hypothetical protein
VIGGGGNAWINSRGPAVHIHPNPIASVSVGVHSAGAAEKAAAAQRAAETRRKLMKRAGQIEAEAAESLDADGLRIVGKWSEEGSSQRKRPAPIHKQGAQTGGDRPGPTPISVWA